ncbi:MAG: DNA mismatch repair protein MutS [Bacteroidales bacterium]|nr:DNA mismatch repair protein MutS [Bacteroidales bacterium]
MTFKSVLDIDCGIRFMYDNLGLNSSCARKMLLETPMMTSKREIDLHYAKLNQLFNKNLVPIANKLMCLKDIENTIKRVAGGIVLDDIELFEIKYLAMIARDVRLLLQEQKITAVNLPDLQEVVDILDPDRLNIPSFYVYDSYSEALMQVRKEIKSIVGYGKEVEGEDKQQLLELQKRNDEIEAEVRGELSGRIRGHSNGLGHALKNLALLDILIAKVVQMKEMGLCFPSVTEVGETFYEKMFNPMVKDALNAVGKEFYPVDICFSNVPVTIIGANMGGKSVVLKTLALNQLLCQFGFGVAAQVCCVKVVGKVMFCIGDDQNATKGLSSFAAEMLAINGVVKSLREGENILALVDEPARTTNPVEGTALVEGLLEVIKRGEGGFVLTTHYNIKSSEVKRYRVKGLKDGVMDYTLIEADSGDVPHEAVSIAQSLGIDAEWIELTRKHLNN